MDTMDTMNTMDTMETKVFAMVTIHIKMYRSGIAVPFANITDPQSSYTQRL